MSIKKKLTVFVISVVCLVIIYTCDSLEPQHVENETEPYMTLQIGDIRQYYSSRENLYFHWEVVDTTYRTDSLKLFVLKYSIITPNGPYSSESYHFIRDGYFWHTRKDSIVQSNKFVNNPFYESKVSIIYPKESEIFLRTYGVPDSEKVYHRIQILDTLKAGSFVFEDVQEIEIIDTDTLYNVWLYYAPIWGHVATKIENINGSDLAYPVYLKIGSREIGNRFK